MYKIFNNLGGKSPPISTHDIIAFNCSTQDIPNYLYDLTTRPKMYKSTASLYRITILSDKS